MAPTPSPLNTQDTPDIMEVTLRDGSYVIDFQFTAEDTATMVAALEAAGLRWIEIGHGLGLNAADRGHRSAADPDEAHLEAAAEAAGQARWGAFFIPGIGRESDIRLAGRYGMSFIRIGTNVDSSAQAYPYIDLARQAGMLVCYNAMKSYAVTPAAFARVAADAQAHGAHVVYLVDSAGTMMPEDVTAFLRAVRDTCDVPVGFHGHDNLSLGTANTLAAVEGGAALVDSSMRGMGRSAGNVITEALVATMQRRGYLAHIDLKRVMDISAGLVAPLVPGRGLEPMDITAGYAGFHSSFTDKVRQYARDYGIDVRDLIVRLCERNRIDAPDDELRRLSEQLAAEAPPRGITIPAFGVRSEADTGAADTDPDAALTALLRRLYAEATKAHNRTVLNVVHGPPGAYHVGQHIHSTALHTIGSVTLHTEAQLRAALARADGAADIVLLDIDRRAGGDRGDAAAVARARLQHSELLCYSDGRIWADAVRDQALRLLDDAAAGQRVVVAGDHPRSRWLALSLVDHGAAVTLIAEADTPPDDSVGQALGALALSPGAALQTVPAQQAAAVLPGARMVVVWPAAAAWFGAEHAVHLAPGAYVLDAVIGGMQPGTLAIARERGAQPIRVNIWPTLAGALYAAHESARVRRESLGWAEWNGVPVVAGGAIGDAGAVIVDSVRRPTRVIGVADGRGGVVTRYNTEQARRVSRVLEAINRQRVTPQTSG